MLQHEFEGLTGLKVTEEQFEVINAMYMLTGIRELVLELERANGTMDYMGKRWFYTTTDVENKLAAIDKILKGGAE